MRPAFAGCRMGGAQAWGAGSLQKLRTVSSWEPSREDRTSGPGEWRPPQQAKVARTWASSQTPRKSPPLLYLWRPQERGQPRPPRFLKYRTEFKSCLGREVSNTSHIEADHAALPPGINNHSHVLQVSQVLKK